MRYLIASILTFAAASVYGQTPTQLKADITSSVATLKTVYAATDDTKPTVSNIAILTQALKWQQASMRAWNNELTTATKQALRAEDKINRMREDLGI